MRQSETEKKRDYSSSVQRLSPLESGPLEVYSAPEIGPLSELPTVNADPYVVQSGDSISKILGTSDPAAIGAFMRANGLTDSTIRPGDKLILPAGNYSRADAALGQSTLNRDNTHLSNRWRPASINAGFYGSLDMPAYSNLAMAGSGDVGVLSGHLYTANVGTYKDAALALSDYFGNASFGLDVAQGIYETPLKFDALQTLNNASPLHNGGMVNISSSSLVDGLETYSSRSTSMQQIGASLDRLGSTGRAVPVLGDALSAADGATYIYAAPEGNRVQAAAAFAADQVGGGAVTFGSMVIGAEIGLAAGPYAPVASPVLAVGFGVLAGFGWDATASESIRTWGYQTEPGARPPLSSQQQQEFDLLMQGVVKRRP